MCVSANHGHGAHRRLSNFAHTRHDACVFLNRTTRAAESTEEICGQKKHNHVRTQYNNNNNNNKAKSNSSLNVPVQHFCSALKAYFNQRSVLEKTSVLNVCIHHIYGIVMFMSYSLGGVCGVHTQPSKARRSTHSSSLQRWKRKRVKGVREGHGKNTGIYIEKNSPGVLPTVMTNEFES